MKPRYVFVRDEVRNAVIEECVRAVEALTWTIPLYPSSENINVAAGEVAGIVVRQAADTIRKLTSAKRET